jgi:hypothetical protein
VRGVGRGHGAVYDGLNEGRVEIARLRVAVAGLPLPRWADGRIRLGIDVSSWLRPGAETSPGRQYCHVHGRGRNAGQVIAGWPYSWVMALGPGASAWTLPLDAVRLGPGDDDLQAAAAQLREVVTRLIEAGQWRDGDPDILVALDSGYNVSRLAWLLAGLPVILVARVRADRVFYRPGPGRVPGAAGRPVKHGPPVRCADPATWGGADCEHDGAQARHGPVRATAWNRVHQMIHKNCGGWEDQRGDYPVIEGSLIRLRVLRGGIEAMWLWASAPAADDAEVRSLWACYLRRFDLEHTFRFLKQQLGWTRPLLRWTWLLLACCAQLYLARGLALLTRMPWQPKAPAGGILTPGQARAGFPRVRETLGTPASPKKPSAPGPGRPKGSKNKHKAPRYPVGKTSPKTRRAEDGTRKRVKRTG